MSIGFRVKHIRIHPKKHFKTPSLVMGEASQIQAIEEIKNNIKDNIRGASPRN